jgi:hypothetical protein
MDDWWCARRPCGAVPAQSRSGGCLLLQAGVGETVGAGAGLDDVAAKVRRSTIVAGGRGSVKVVAVQEVEAGCAAVPDPCAAEVQECEGVGPLIALRIRRARRRNLLTDFRRRSMT